ncbi:zinc finger protein 316-like isoform X2 [Conger conger]|uniref:zinc finger protein 316-like isoform X2 n=1 Tax=Conger conger TaxID=82655 RepID=UPI002A59B6B7|nr:zinc finger protein 316-like isoform X2 [Conger conger]
MWEDARTSFHSQLGSVMESLLAAAVCQISRIFEGSLSDSRAEVQRAREEVALLNRKLETLEGRLKEASSTRDAVTFDPGSFAQEQCPGLGKTACLSEGPEPGSLETGSQVKAELQVEELEPTSLTQDCAEMERVRVKEECAGENPAPWPVEEEEEEEEEGGTGVASYLCTDPRLEAVADGSVRWAGLPEGACPSPMLTQKCEKGEGPSECVPHQPRPSRPEGVAKRHGDMEGGARTGLSPAPDHTPRNTHTHRPPTDHTHRPPTDHAHRLSPDCALSPRLPWHRPPQTHALPGGQGQGGAPQGRFQRSAYGAVLSSHLPRRPSPCPAAAVRVKPPLSALPARERPYGCAFCGKAFFYPSQQRRHLLRHTGERRYPCAQCEKSFVTPSERSVHVRVHTGEKPYCCALCGKRFNRTGNLRAHERDVHQGKRPYSCAECGKTFAQKGNLRTHQQRVHQATRP